MFFFFFFFLSNYPIGVDRKSMSRQLSQLRCSDNWIHSNWFKLGGWTNHGKSTIFDGDSLDLAKILLDLAVISPNLAKISPYMQRMALF